MEIGLTEEQASKVFALNGVDVEREKAKTNSAKADLADAQAKLTTANTELETLKKANGDIAAVQQQLSDLQQKYDTDTTALKGQLADRDYSDALERGITSKVPDGFTSKSGRESLVARAREKKLELKDGELVGLDDVIKAHREEDPGAYATSKPAPSFGERRVGGGGGQPETTGETLAAQLGKTAAEQNKAANDIISMYTKGEI